MDAISTDSQYALTIIAFVGSVFSPYYAWSGWRNPLNHCAINIALYGPRGARWTMTERRATDVRRSTDRFDVGPSHVTWQNGTLLLNLDEIGCPLPKKVRGQVRVTPTAVTGQSFDLTADGRHTWQPVAPHATVSVNLEKPDLSWSGNGYIDSNYGTEPLEDGFSDWTWSRAHRLNDSLMYYTANLLEGGQSHLGLKVANGHCEIVDVPPDEVLKKTGWRMARSIRSDPGTTSIVKSTLEDTPFYARSLVEAELMGQRIDTIHESLCLKRFSSPWVRMLLPFRMPRRLF